MCIPREDIVVYVTIKCKIKCINLFTDRKGIDKYLTELYCLEAEKNEETKMLKSMVKKEEETIQMLKGELLEILNKKYFLSVSLLNMSV